MSLTVNEVGFGLAAAALVAVLVIGSRTVEVPKSAPASASVSTVVPAKSAQVLKPKPLVSAHTSGCTVEKPCPVVKPATVYRKVLTNGKLDGRIGCRYVPKIASKFDRQQVLAAAEQYGLSPAQLSALRVCLN